MSLIGNTDLSELISRLQQRVPVWMNEARVPGLSVALIHDARVCWAQGFGVTSTAKPQSVTTGTVFEFASLTKPVFTYCVLKLCELGALSLDRPLSEYLPDPYLPDEPLLPLVTARHVLSHSPGFPNWRAKGQPLRIYFTPGARFSYSGEGFIYLQHVVEHVTGQPLSQYAHDHLLEPFGMSATSFVWQDAYDVTCAEGHDPDGHPVQKQKPTQANAAYSMHSTPHDYASFMLAIIQPELQDRHHLGAQSISEMLRVQCAINDLAPWNPSDELPGVMMNPYLSWGLGWGLQRMDDANAFWQWGDNGSFQTFAMGFPAERSGFVCASDRESGRSLWQALAAELLGSEQPALHWLERIYA